MGYNPLVDNLGVNWEDDFIFTSKTLAVWNTRSLYSLAAPVSGSLTITLPALPDTNNLLECGSIFFRRVDANVSTVVTIQAIIGGVSKAINVPVGTDVHWFTSMLMVRDGFNDCLYSRMSPNFLTALSGDVTTNTVGNSDVTVTTVNFVGGKSANAINTSVMDTQAATDTFIAGAIVKRNSSTGNFSGNTANFQAIGNSKAVITDGSGNLAGSSVSSSTLAFLDATSSVQTQIDSKVPIVQNQKTVKVATSTVIALSGLQTIDGVSLVAGDEVLQAQTTAIVNNGIWVVASGAWTRSTQMPTGSDASKAKIFVLQGTLNAGTIWTCTNATGSLVGTASLAIPIFTPAVSALYTNLTAAITNSATTLSVTTTNGFPPTGIVMILNEVILYTGKTSNSFTGCVRAYNGTTAVAAVINAYVNFVTEEIPYYKMGADFITSANPVRIFRDIMWMSGAAPAVRTWTPSQIPWVYTDITAAELACIYWVQKLTTFLKSLENDTHWDQLIGAIPSAIVSRITGNLQTPDGGTDMDNQVGFNGTTTYASEWFELIVGRNPAGTELYTMSFTVALITTASTVTNATDVLYPFRIIWQTTRGAAMAGFNGQTAAGISSSVPKCTQYTTSGVTIPAAGFPIWAIPVSLETTF